MKHLSMTTLAALMATVCTAKLESHFDGGKVPPVHRLAVKDISGDTVSPGDPNPLPVSTRNTCSLCHDYGTIAQGWHFNAADTNACPGRTGEPWFLIDQVAGTQLPLSYRKWQGTFSPEDAGLDAFAFTDAFGRNLPGGGVSSPDEEGLCAGRWNVSGGLEINCFACHDTSGTYDHSEFAKQMARQNFSWAMSAAMGWGEVDGMASRMPEYWGVLNGPNRDDSIFRVPPRIEYDAKRFDSKERLVLTVGKPRNENCLNCHGSAQVDVPRMEADKDVHLRAGMSCTDCHKNGEDHKISRGYEHKGIDHSKMSLTCAGCHVAKDGKAGRYGAPAPKHVGFPLVHFEKLACTVCHSGVTKDGKVATVSTSRANRMGIYGRAKWLTDAPFIQEPVFVKNDKSGKIEPRRMVWPAFWGTRDGENVKPIPSAKVLEIAGKTLSVMKDVGQVLSILDSDPNYGAHGLRPVLAVEGKLFRANVDGVPVKFGEQEGLNGFFYVVDDTRAVPAKQQAEIADKQAALIAENILKLWPREQKTWKSVVPAQYDPNFDTAVAAEAKAKELASIVDTVVKADETFAKLSADEQKAKREEISESILADVKARFDEEQDAKTKTIGDLITTLDASALYVPSTSGAVVTSGKIFFKNRGVPDVVAADAPSGAASVDFGFYDAEKKAFVSLCSADAAKQVALLADTHASLTEEMVAATLKKLAASGLEKTVYVGHGQVWELQNDQLVASVEKAAEPVSWAIGHDVRPARMARGAKPVKCADCHTADSDFFFGKISSTGPLLTSRKLVKAQNEYLQVDPTYNRLFGAMFLVRPFFKIFLWVVFAIFGLVSIAFTAAAVPSFLSNGGIPYGKKCENLTKTLNTLSGWAMGFAGVYLGLSGAFGWATGTMTGYILVCHQLAGGLFCAALLALIWFRGKNRLATKRSFWWMLAMTLAVLVVFTAVAPMMTIFGYGWQKTLLMAHRCSAFSFLAVAAWMLVSGGRKE